MAGPSKRTDLDFLDGGHGGWFQSVIGEFRRWEQPSVGGNWTTTTLLTTPLILLLEAPLGSFGLSKTQPASAFSTSLFQYT